MVNVVTPVGTVKGTVNSPFAFFVVVSVNAAPLTLILPLVAFAPPTASVTWSPTTSVVGSTAVVPLYTLMRKHWLARGTGVGVAVATGAATAPAFWQLAGQLICATPQ